MRTIEEQRIKKYKTRVLDSVYSLSLKVSHIEKLCMNTIIFVSAMWNKKLYYIGVKRLSDHTVCSPGDAFTMQSCRSLWSWKIIAALSCGLTYVNWGLRLLYCTVSIKYQRKRIAHAFINLFYSSRPFIMALHTFLF